MSWKSGYLLRRFSCDNRFMIKTGAQKIFCEYMLCERSVRSVGFHRAATRRESRASQPCARSRIWSSSRRTAQANFANFAIFGAARFRLYRSRFFQPNTIFSAFFEIYKICILLHRSILKFCRFFAMFFAKISGFSRIFAKFC